MTKYRKKLIGRSGNPSVKLKAAWRELSDDARAGLMEMFLSSHTQVEIREVIRQQFGIDLRSDPQLTRFRQWAETEEEHLLMAEKIEERKKELLERGMTLEQAQQVLLMDASSYSIAARDFKLMARVSSEITKLQNALLGRDKFQFDAVAVCRRELPALKEIEENPSLSEAEKTRLFMETIFGIQPVTAPVPDTGSPAQQN